MLKRFLSKIIGSIAVIFVSVCSIFLIHDFEVTTRTYCLALQPWHLANSLMLALSDKAYLSSNLEQNVSEFYVVAFNNINVFVILCITLDMSKHMITRYDSSTHTIYSAPGIWPLPREKYLGGWCWHTIIASFTKEVNPRLAKAHLFQICVQLIAG